MKNAKFLCSMMAAFLLLSGLLFASVSPKIELVNYSLSENPVMPGHTLYLTLVLKSMESDNCADRIAVSVTTSYPLSLTGSDTQYLEHLCLGDPASAGTFTFALPIDNLAASGTYSVAVSTTYEKRFSKFSEANTLNVRVAGAPHLVASVASSSPIDLYPGDDAAMTIAIDNTGNSLAQSVRATLASDSRLEVKWAGADQGVGAIAARSSSNAAFSIFAPKDLPAGRYPVRLHISFANENQSAESADFTFYVPVKPKAEFSATEADGGMLAGISENVPITLTNTGSLEARRLKVRIQPLFPFSTDGTVRYVDSLAPGQSVNLTYTVTVDKQATDGQQLLGLGIDFEDPAGKKFSDTADFAMSVREPTPTELAYKYWYVFAIVLIAVVLLVRRMSSGKKPAKK